jgi:YVTN family beta-propeller protein
MGRLKSSAKIAVGEPDKKKETFVGGIAINPAGTRLYGVNVFGQTFSAIDTSRRSVVKTIPLPAEPYTCLVARDGRSVFVSLWGGAKILVFDAETLEQTAAIAVGEHPNAMVQSPEGGRLFVACANTNAVWVVDLASKAAKEQISIALYPSAPPGSTPNSVALSPDGRTLWSPTPTTTPSRSRRSIPAARAGDRFLPTGGTRRPRPSAPTGEQIPRPLGQGARLLSQPPRAAAPRSPRRGGAAHRRAARGLPLDAARARKEALVRYTKTVYDLTHTATPAA